MEQEPFESGIDQRPDNVKPLPDTDFDGVTESTPLARSRFAMGGINDWIFSKMRPKRPVAQKRRQTYGGVAPVVPAVGDNFEIQNGLLVNKKNTFEIARDQLKNRFAFTASHKFVNGLALVVLLAGVFAIYSELPTHPELVIGIVLVSLAGNVLVGSKA
jgi:hypothetical protein